jgi:hypothetical protein
MRWLRWVLVALATAFLAVYGGDCAVYKLRGSPNSKVTVNRFLAIPLKGDKQEYEYMGTQEVSCARALFVQQGQAPCWQLRRNANQWTKM